MGGGSSNSIPTPLWRWDICGFSGFATNLPVGGSFKSSPAHSPLVKKNHDPPLPLSRGVQTLLQGHAQGENSPNLDPLAAGKCYSKVYNCRSSQDNKH